MIVLRAIVPEPTDWFDDAACRDADADLFFSQDEPQQQAALEHCAICPVRQQCLEHAMRKGEHYGIWGGTREGERRRLSRRHEQAA